MSGVPRLSRNHVQPRFFDIENFRGQTPWFGPYLGGRRMIVSSPGEGLPADTAYQVIGWVFDTDGQMLAECDLGERHANEPVTFDLAEAFPEVPSVRGMVGMLLQPKDSSTERAAINEAWTFRFVDDRGINDLWVSEIARDINFPERTGRQGTFRLLSPELCVDDGWRPLACVLNVSCNPDYATAIRLKVAIYNDKGEGLEDAEVEVPPFGTAWIDPVEMFGEKLSRHIGGGGRGAYIATTDDGSAIAYHFIYNPVSGDIAGDHTRPVMRYLPRAYGVSGYAIEQPLSFKLKALAHYLRFRLTG